MADLAQTLSGLRGVRHITRTDAGGDSYDSVLTADLSADAADDTLATLARLGVPPQDVVLLRLDDIQPLAQRDEARLVWAELLHRAGVNARPVPRYLVFMAVAGVIAAYGVIYRNEALIVGAMAVSPDLLPITAICVALVLGRPLLAGRALVTLAAGLGLAGLVAGVLTAVLDPLGLLPSSFSVGESGLDGLTSVNSSTFLVALTAGVAGMLALETRASAAVGVAISVTTIPASAYLGVAAGEGEVDKALGALAVLGINVTMLATGGTLALLTQRAVARRSQAPAS
jgi:uncharacterized hydrophobic protein (TIGR00271 family)